MPEAVLKQFQPPATPRFGACRLKLKPLNNLLRGQK
jgi:hypothetical protein